MSDTHKDTIALLSDLIRCPSVTPTDAGCQPILIEKLNTMGFTVTELPAGDVSNFFARLGTEAPLFVFAGHTDVVPAGDAAQWHTDPFEATIHDDVLYGRGAADMKGSLAAIITATQQFLHNHPAFKGSIGFLITSDEEGDAIDGTAQVVDYLQTNHIDIDYCLVGEPTANSTTGDTIKTGRRGSLHGTLTLQGTQGHIAYPHLADNPIHNGFAALDALCKTSWCEGNEHFDPTTFQISAVHAGTGATNVIPGTCTYQFNFRYAPSVRAEDLQAHTQKILDTHGLHYTLDLSESAKPFHTRSTQMAEACQHMLKHTFDTDCTLSTSGGTSDARFIQHIAENIIELGPPNATIHQANECIALSELSRLTDIYTEILALFLR